MTMTENEPSEILELDRKTDLVLRLLRGDDVHALSEESGYSVATLARWRDEFCSAGRRRLAERTGGWKVLTLRTVKGIVWSAGVVFVVLIGGCVLVATMGVLP